jgi:hypothetical protein
MICQCIHTSPVSSNTLLHSNRLLLRIRCDYEARSSWVNVPHADSPPPLPPLLSLSHTHVRVVLTNVPEQYCSTVSGAKQL